jgi:hypothetical protein
MPDAQSVAMLFHRFKTSSRGGKGFTSLNDNEISVSAFGLATVTAVPEGVPDALLPGRLSLLRLTCYPTRVQGPTP